MTKLELKLDWCPYEAAKYAVEKWHYSQRMPAGKLIHVGVWECGAFIGVIIYGRGANRNMAGEFGLKTTECCELVRVALRSHSSPVSRIVSIANRIVSQFCGGLRLIISYADPAHGHHGGIYQAMGWVFVGHSRPQSAIVGMHKRSAASKYGTIKGLQKTTVAYKHKYLMPLDAAMRAQIEPLRKPYPKRVRGVAGDTSANHAEEGGSIPTRTL